MFCDSQWLAEFSAKNLASNQFAVTLIDLRDREHPVQAAYRGEEPIYPASVIKLFYLAAALTNMNAKNSWQLKRLNSKVR